MKTWIDRLLVDDSGQDLVEYMLLTTVIGIAAVLGVQALGDSINFVYGIWDANIQSPTVVEVADPITP